MVECCMLETSALQEMGRCSPGFNLGIFQFYGQHNFLLKHAKISLARLGIRAVVNCAPNLPNHHERQAINEKEAINDKQAINENHQEEKAISYLRFPIGKWKANSGEDDFLLQTFLATFLQLSIRSQLRILYFQHFQENVLIAQSPFCAIIFYCKLLPFSLISFIEIVKES